MIIPSKISAKVLHFLFHWCLMLDRCEQVLKKYHICIFIFYSIYVFIFLYLFGKCWYINRFKIFKTS
jgi:hypothetical protein